MREVLPGQMSHFVQRRDVAQGAVRELSTQSISAAVCVGWRAVEGKGKRLGLISGALFRPVGAGAANPWQHERRKAWQ